MTLMHFGRRTIRERVDVSPCRRCVRVPAWVVVLAGLFAVIQYKCFDVPIESCVGVESLPDISIAATSHGWEVLGPSQKFDSLRHTRVLKLRTLFMTCVSWHSPVWNGHEFTTYVSPSVHEPVWARLGFEPMLKRRWVTDERILQSWPQVSPVPAVVDANEATALRPVFAAEFDRVNSDLQLGEAFRSKQIQHYVAWVNVAFNGRRCAMLFGAILLGVGLLRMIVPTQSEVERMRRRCGLCSKCRYPVSETTCCPECGWGFTPQI